jgi:prepilin-type N-terminal cleavage/methylation domain-containing protein
MHAIFLAGDEGFEPPNDGTRTRCLTAWPIPKAVPSYHILAYFTSSLCTTFSLTTHTAFATLSSMKRWRGFTIVELVVVIAVIGILAAITTIGFSRYQQTSRDNIRNSKANVIASSLEKYYSQHGEYPGCSQLASPADASTVTGLTGALQNVDSGALVAPQATSSTNNSITCGDLTSLSGPDVFAYVGDGSSTCNSGSSCLSFTLKYKDESNGTIDSISSIHTTNINTSGTISDLSATATSLMAISLSWSALGNANGYSIKYNQTAPSVGGVQTASSTTASFVATGLTPGATYQFQVAANSASGQSGWSNTATATVWKLVAPVLTASTASSTSINLTWPDVPHEENYTLQYTTSSSSWTTPVPTSLTLPVGTTSKLITGLTTGTPYYFRLQANGTGDTSPWSNTATATPIGQAVIASTSASTCGGVTVNWNALSGASTYTIRYSTNSSMSGSTAVTGATGTSKQVTGLSQGQTMYFTVEGVTAQGYSGQASAIASQMTTICPPAAYNLTQSGYLTAWNNAICAAGTTTYYNWYANGGGWVSGTQYQAVTYSLGYGQGITLTSSAYCYNANGQSGTVGANNAAAASLGVPSPTLNGLSRVNNSSGSYDRVYASWSNVCNGYHELLLRQGSYTDTTNNHPLPNGPYDFNDNRLWYSTGTAQYNVRVQCNGVWSDWSNEQDVYVTA